VSLCVDMDRDTEIWRTLLKERRFLRNKEIKKLLPHLNDAQLSKSLRRLEKLGLLIRDFRFVKDKPINVYLAIDPSKIKVRIVDLKHWLHAIVEWADESGKLIHLEGIDLGELANYIHGINEELYLQWPKWIMEAKKVSFEENSFDVPH